MSRGTLPLRPNLEQLKHQAKDLLRLARNRDPDSLQRFRILPAFARSSADDLAETRLALHDAQSVIAREHDFPSWKALIERVEESTLRFDQAVDEFVLAATDGRVDRAKRILALHPEIPRTSFHAALVIGDRERVEAHLHKDPTLATRRGGARDWPAILYVCHTSMHGAGTAPADSLADIARQLLANGADANQTFPWSHHGVHRRALWGATLATRCLPLSGVLLDAGADPNDGVTLPIAASGGAIETLDFLFAHGADPNQPWATDGSATLYAILHWTLSSAGPMWLLEHGADADPVFAPNGETPLHKVAERGDVALAEALVARGADVSRPRADGRTPYAIAEINGNRDVAAWLLAHGAADEMSPVDRLIATCSRGDRAAAETMLAANPDLRDAYGDEHYAALHRAAETGDVRALDALLAVGLDPNRGDAEIGKTALHSAAGAGQVEATRVLLAHGASPAVRDREFHGQPLAWAAHHGPEHEDAGRHEAVAFLLMDAGSPLDWEAGSEPAAAMIETMDAWRRAWERSRGN